MAQSGPSTRPVSDTWPFLRRRGLTSKSSRSGRIAWNRGKIVGQKPPLKIKEVWAIRVRLQLAEKARDLALFNLAIDSKLRGSRHLRDHRPDVVGDPGMAASVGWRPARA